MTTHDPATALPDDIRHWVESEAGQPVAHVERIVGGASRASAILTMADGHRLFLRRETGSGPLANTPFTLAREQAVIQSLAGTRVPAPGIVAFSATYEALIMEVVPGFTSYQRSLSEPEEAVVRRELVEAIVALQAIDPMDAPGLALGPKATIGEALAADLTLWTTLYHERVARPDPLVEAALAWLGLGTPDADLPPVIVHGDIGPGNFLINDGHISALIDWELVRIGHPLEDLACVIARGLGAPFGTDAEHIANYEAASGRRVEPADLDYALVFVLVRWMIAISIGLSRPASTQDVPMLLAFHQINGRSLLAAILRREGMAPAPVPRFDGAAHPATQASFSWCRAVIADLAASPALDPADRYRLSGAGGVLAFLNAFDHYGSDRYETEEVTRIETLLNSRFINWHDAVSALCKSIRDARRADWTSLLRHVEWRTLRDHVILRDLMGARANNVVGLPA